jgi:hypothetical protein
MPATPTPFFAPTFFTPYYFPSLVAPGGGAQQPTQGYRDRDAFAAVVEALSETHEFAGVFLNTTPGQMPAGADQTPAVLVSPDTWSEVDDVDLVDAVRRVGFTLTIIVSDNDPAARYDALDRLSCVAQNALDGADLGGGCIGALTKTRRGQFVTTLNLPEQGVALHGEFTYLIPDLNGRSTSN